MTVERYRFNAVNPFCPVKREYEESIVELRQLNYFLSTARHLSFTRAAEECCIVQSAMSQQIRALEKELGVTLFERGKRGLRLTPEGEAMVREARKLLSQLEEAQSAVRLAGKRRAERLRIGRQGDLFYAALPRALRAFRGQYPDVRLTLQPDRYDALLEALREDRLDCAIVLIGGDAALPEDFERQTLRQEALYVAMPADHALASAGRISPKQLMERELILRRDEPWSALAGEIAAREGVKAPQCACAYGQSCAEALVAAGYGVSVCAESELRFREGVAYRRLDCGWKAQTCLLWRGEAVSGEYIGTLSSLLMMNESK